MRSQLFAVLALPAILFFTGVYTLPTPVVLDPNALSLNGPVFPRGNCCGRPRNPSPPSSGQSSPYLGTPGLSTPSPARSESFSGHSSPSKGSPHSTPSHHGDWPSPGQNLPEARTNWQHRQGVPAAYHVLPHRDGRPSRVRYDYEVATSRAPEAHAPAAVHPAAPGPSGAFSPSRMPFTQHRPTGSPPHDYGNAAPSPSPPGSPGAAEAAVVKTLREGANLIDGVEAPRAA